jgi:hypothetical protein
MNIALVSLGKEYSRMLNDNIKIHQEIRKLGVSMLKFCSYWLQSASMK